MAPEPRRFQAGDRELIVRLNMANILTATRRFRKLLSEFGITNIIGAGSERLLAAASGEGPMSSMEAEAVVACSALVENSPEIGIEEFLELVEKHPGLADEVEAEWADFIRPRRHRMAGLMALIHSILIGAIAQAAGIDMDKVAQLVAMDPTGGPGSARLPSSTSDSPSGSSGDPPSAT
jgi:hypothetical protein